MHLPLEGHLQGLNILLVEQVLQRLVLREEGRERAGVLRQRHDEFKRLAALNCHGLENSERAREEEREGERNGGRESQRRTFAPAMEAYSFWYSGTALKAPSICPSSVTSARRAVPAG